MFYVARNINIEYKAIKTLCLTHPAVSGTIKVICKIANSTQNPSRVLVCHLVYSSDLLCDEHTFELPRSSTKLHVPHLARALLGIAFVSNM